MPSTSSESGGESGSESGSQSGSQSGSDSGSDSGSKSGSKSGSESGSKSGTGIAAPIRTTPLELVPSPPALEDLITDKLYTKILLEVHPVLPRAVGMGAQLRGPKPPAPTLSPSTHFYSGVCVSLKSPIWVRSTLKKKISEADLLTAKGSGLTYWSAKEGNPKPWVMLNHNLYREGAMRSIRERLNHPLNKEKSTTDQERREWINAIFRGTPPCLNPGFSWPDDATLQEGGPSRVENTGQPHVLLNAFMDYTPTAKLLDMLRTFLEDYYMDLVSLQEAVLATFTWWDLEMNPQLEGLTGLSDGLKLPSVSLVKFIMYFPHFLRRAEDWGLGAYPHPYRFIAEAYDEDSGKRLAEAYDEDDAKKAEGEAFFIEEDGLVEKEVKREIQKLHLVRSTPFFPCDLPGSKIPHFRSGPFADQEKRNTELASFRRYARPILELHLGHYDKAISGSRFSHVVLTPTLSLALYPGLDPAAIRLERLTDLEDLFASRYKDKMCLFMWGHPVFGQGQRRAIADHFADDKATPLPDPPSIKLDFPGSNPFAVPGKDKNEALAGSSTAVPKPAPSEKGKGKAKASDGPSGTSRPSTPSGKGKNVVTTETPASVSTTQTASTLGALSFATALTHAPPSPPQRPSKRVKTIVEGLRAGMTDLTSAEIMSVSSGLMEAHDLETTGRLVRLGLENSALKQELLDAGTAKEALEQRAASLSEEIAELKAKLKSAEDELEALKASQLLPLPLPNLGHALNTADFSVTDFLHFLECALTIRPTPMEPLETASQNREDCSLLIQGVDQCLDKLLRRVKQVLKPLYAMAGVTRAPGRRLTMVRDEYDFKGYTPSPFTDATLSALGEDMAESMEQGLISLYPPEVYARYPGTNPADFLSSVKEADQDALRLCFTRVATLLIETLKYAVLVFFVRHCLEIIKEEEPSDLTLHKVTTRELLADLVALGHLNRWRAPNDVPLDLPFRYMGAHTMPWLSRKALAGEMKNWLGPVSLYYTLQLVEEDVPGPIEGYYDE